MEKRQKKINCNLMICAIPRSGSNLLSEMIGSVKVLGEPDEWLNQDRWNWNLAKFGLDEDADIEEMIAVMQDQLASKQGVFSHKILQYSFNPLIEKLRGIKANKFLSIQELMEKYFPDLKLIYIRREDRLGQAISLWKANQSALWHIKGKEKKEENKIDFSWTAISSIKQDLEEQEAEWQKFFSAMNLPVLEFVYEEFIADKARAFRRIVEFLDLGIHIPEFSLKAVSHKQTRDSINTDWRVKYFAIEEEIKGKRRCSDQAVSAKLKFVSDQVKAVEGESFEVSIEIENTGLTDLKGIGDEEGNGWVKLKLQIENEKWNTDPFCWPELLLDLRPGDSTTRRVSLKAPYIKGRFLLKADLFLTPNSLLSDTGTIETENCTLEIIESPRRAFIKKYFPEASCSLHENLVYCPRFGRFHILQFPKLYHFGLEYLSVKSLDGFTGVIDVFSENFGDLRLDPQQFPVFWCEKESTYLKWYEGTHSPAKLDILKDGEWLPYNHGPNNLFMKKVETYFGSELEDKWFIDSSIFGKLDVREFPVVISNNLGPMRFAVDEANTDSYDFHLDSHGWLWTSSDAYPYVLIHSKKEWIKFEDLV